MERERIVISKSAKRKMTSFINGNVRNEKANAYTEEVIYQTPVKLPNGKTIINSQTRHEIDYSK